MLRHIVVVSSNNFYKQFRSFLRPCVIKKIEQWVEINFFCEIEENYRWNVQFFFLREAYGETRYEELCVLEWHNRFSERKEDKMNGLAIR